jgi:hypothetical protein
MMVLRKRRAMLLNPIVAPRAFLEQVLFYYVPPPPIPGAYIPPPTRRREPTRPEGVRANLWSSGEAREGRDHTRADNARTSEADRRAGRLAIARGQPDAAATRVQHMRDGVADHINRETLRRSERRAGIRTERAADKLKHREREVDERIAHNTRSKQARDEYGANPTGHASVEPRNGRSIR